MTELNKMTAKEIQEFINEEGLDGYKLIESSDWTHDQGSDKYETQELIFLEIATGKHYRTWQTRSGSHWSDWYYEYPTRNGFTEVHKVTKTIEVWEEMK